MLTVGIRDKFNDAQTPTSAEKQDRATTNSRKVQKRCDLVSGQMPCREGSWGECAVRQEWTSNVLARKLLSGPLDEL